MNGSEHYNKSLPDASDRNISTPTYFSSNILYSGVRRRVGSYRASRVRCCKKFRGCRRELGISAIIPPLRRKRVLPITSRLPIAEPFNDTVIKGSGIIFLRQNSRCRNFLNIMVSHCLRNEDISRLHSDQIGHERPTLR